MARSRRRKSSPWIHHALLALVATGLLVTGGVLLLREPSAETLYEKGSNALERGDYSVALDYFQQALAISSDDVRVLEGRARANEALERYDIALSDFEELRRLTPLEPRYLETIGWLHLKNEDYESALSVFNEGARIFPDLRQSFQSHTGHVHYSASQDYLELLEDHLTLVIFNQGSPDSAISTAHEVAFDLDRNREVEDFIDVLPTGIIQEQLDDLRLWLSSSRSHFRLADEALRHVYDSDQFATKTGEVRASIDYYAGHFVDAKKMCDLHLAVNRPPSAKLLTIRANIFSEIGRPDLSAIDFKSMQNSAQKNANLGAFRLELQDRLDSGDFLGVRSTTENRASIRPSDVMNVYLYVKACLGLGKTREAGKAALDSVRYLKRGALAQWAPSFKEKMFVLWGFYEALSMNRFWPEAVNVLGVLLSFDPGNREALRLRAKISEEELLNPSAAHFDALRLLRLGGRQPEAVATWERTGSLLLDLNAVGEESTLDRALSHWKRFRSQPSYSARRDRGEVIDPLEGLVKPIYNDPFLMYALSRTFLDAGDEQEAALLLGKLVRSHTEVDEFSFQLAVLTASRNDHARAVDALRNIYERSPEDGEVARRLSESLRQLGRDGEARLVESQLAKRSPETHGRLLAARRLMGLGELDQADSILLAMQTVMPFDPDARALRAEIQLRRGERSRARLTAQQILTQISPFHPGAMKLMVMLAEPSKGGARQLLPLVELIQGAPRDVNVQGLAEVAALMSERGFVDVAERFLIATRERFPSVGHLMVSLAKVKILKNELEQANKLLSRQEALTVPGSLLYRTLLSLALKNTASPFAPLLKMEAPDVERLGLAYYRSAALAVSGQFHLANKELRVALATAPLTTAEEDLHIVARACIEVLPGEFGGRGSIDEGLEELPELDIERRRDLAALINIGLQDSSKLRDLATAMTRSYLFANAQEFKTLSLTEAIGAAALGPHCGIAIRLLAGRLRHAPIGANELKALEVSGLVSFESNAPIPNAKTIALSSLLKQLSGDQADQLTRNLYWEFVVEDTPLPETLLVASESLAKSLKDTSGPSVSVGLLYARAAWTSGRPEAAIQQLLGLAGHFPNEINVVLELAEVYQQLEMIPRAQQVLLGAVRVHPNSIRARRALLSSLRRYPIAKEVVSSTILPLILKNPGLFDLYAPVIDSLPGKNLNDIALKLAKELLIHTKNRPSKHALEALTAIGEALVTNNDPAATPMAKRLLVHAEGLDPLSPRVLRALGIAHSRLGQYLEAERCLTLYETAFGSDADALAVLAELNLNHLGKPELAAQLAEESIDRSIIPDPRALSILAEWDALNNRFTEASVSLSYMNDIRLARLGLDPNDEDAKNDEVRIENLRKMGLWALFGGDFAGAIRNLAELYRATPPHLAHAQVAVLTKHALESVKALPLHQKAAVTRKIRLGRTTQMQKLALLPDPKRHGYTESLSWNVFGPWPTVRHQELNLDRPLGPPVPPRFVHSSQMTLIPIGPFPEGDSVLYPPSKLKPSPPLGPILPGSDNPLRNQPTL